MGIFDEIMAMDSQFLATMDEVSETILYYAAGSRASARPISAYVMRRPPERLSIGTGANGAGNAMSNDLMISVDNNANTGISSAEFDTTGTVDLKRNIGDATTETFRLVRIEQQDGAKLLIRVR